MKKLKKIVSFKMRSHSIRTIYKGEVNPLVTRLRKIKYWKQRLIKPRLGVG